MKLVFVLAFLLIFTIGKSNAQELSWGEESVNISKFQIDYQENVKSYLGNYHFGVSESESNLALTMKKDKLFGELSFGNWDAKGEKWIDKKIVLKNLKITGNLLIADGWYGMFVTTFDSESSKTIKGLVIFKGEKGEYDIENEFGAK